VSQTLAGGAFRFYRWLVSPWFRGSCRYYPSCSHYAEEAFARHGAVRGAYLSFRRLLCCHPWGGHGVDLVP
jgi:putative membrane protein insertion efficiency factor